MEERGWRVGGGGGRLLKEGGWGRRVGKVAC